MRIPLSISMTSRLRRDAWRTACLAATLLLRFAQAAPAQQSAFVIGMIDRDAATTRAVNPLDSDFSRSQLSHPRVLQARLDARFGIKQLYRARGLTYPASEIFLRVFKRERMLELWVRTPESQRFALLKSYRICALAGEIGPKRQQGDNQTPEGFYEVDSFNPNSEYLLSLHVNYPNASDRALGNRAALGGSIYIHGGCKTLGCIAVTDDAIKELYWIAVEARAAGQERIPVHIFPARLTDEEMKVLGGTFKKRPDLMAFWNNLKPGYEFFERWGAPPAVAVEAGGRYRFLDRSRGLITETGTGEAGKNR
jgi:murein L,D-transpeptidase YafK